MAKKSASKDSPAMSKSGQLLVKKLKGINLPASASEPDMISVAFDEGETNAVVRWGSIMYPYIKISLNDVVISDLERDGIRIHRTWNYKG